MNIYEALKYYYGYDSFRPGQEEVVRELAAGRPVLAVLPTGAGKSVCFQLPSLLMEGLTLVVSPLLSLMQDQSEQLCSRGIRAAYLGSNLTESAVGRILYACLQGRIKLLYVAPERLSMPSFQSFAQRAHISFVAIDEAHCVSQWGRSFRKDYYNIPLFLEQLSEKPLVAAFTATATPDVRRDILKHLNIPHAKTVVTGFDRPNLTFRTRHAWNKPQVLLEYLREHRQENGIIYCATRKLVEQVASMLVSLDFRALRYHAGLTSKERQQNQRLFVEGEVPLIVATNAFGMGINKSDVRFVVHYNMPKDVESYYQEAGRAGRDGLPADCLLLWNMDDMKINSYLINHANKDKRVLDHEKQLLLYMHYYSRLMSGHRQYILRYFGELQK